MITDDAITFILGLIVLVTVISVVRSGAMAQLNMQFKRKTGLSDSVIAILETIVIFIFAVIALPLIKSVIQSIKPSDFTKITYPNV